MLLGRVIEYVEAQNWFAVGIGLTCLPIVGPVNRVEDVACPEVTNSARA